MQPKEQKSSPQLDMFRKRLAHILNHQHELYRLVDLIDWQAFDEGLGTLYSENGRPGIFHPADGWAHISWPRLQAFRRRGRAEMGGKSLLAVFLRRGVFSA